MQRLVTLAIVVGLGWLAYTRYQHHQALSVSPKAETSQSGNSAPSEPAAQNMQSASFSCDGRTYCSEMRSCEEAKYFLDHCQNTKMDGDHDGIPCERQWCADGAR
jgi:hypothetical protein